MKTPTDAEKIKMYQDFLHKINLCCTCMRDDIMRKLIQNADSWSYAHRVGNGEPTEEEQQAFVNARFWELLKVD